MALRRWWPFPAGGVALLLGVGLFFLIQQTTQPLPGEEVALEGAQHVREGTALQYRSYPPASGPHYPRPLPWGVYDTEIPEGYWVHSLEHSGIVILYNCPQGCPDLVEQLREAYRTFPPSKWGMVKLAIVPNSKIQHKIAVLAWGRRDQMDDFDGERVLRFYRAYLDRGPEDAP